MKSRERLAGFCFRFAQTDFLCVFFLFLEIHCRQALPAEIIIFKGKISCKHVLSLSVCPRSAKPWAGLLSVPSPAMHQPSAPTSTMLPHQPCLYHSCCLPPLLPSTPPPRAAPLLPWGSGWVRLAPMKSKTWREAPSLGDGHDFGIWPREESCQ